MTNMEKRQIARLREQGLGYTQIANRLGISKSTVSTFCQRNGLAEDKKEKPQKPNNSLRSGALRVNTVTTDPRPTTVVSCNDEVVKITCKVTVTYADKPDETAVADVLDILRNARRSEN